MLAGCGSADEVHAPPTTRTDALEPATYASELYEHTNDVRVENDIEPLVVSSCAQEQALERAAALVGEPELIHAPLAPVIDACAPRTTAAENLVNSAASPVEVVDAWLRSPGHRANIVDPTLTEVGIGCVPDGDQLLCAQVFLGP